MIDQADQGNGRIADACRKVGEIVLGLFFERVENIQPVQSADTFGFITGFRC